MFPEIAYSSRGLQSKITNVLELKSWIPTTRNSDQRILGLKVINFSILTLLPYSASYVRTGILISFVYCYIFSPPKHQELSRCSINIYLARLNLYFIDGRN